MLGRQMLKMLERPGLWTARRVIACISRQQALNDVCLVGAMLLKTGENEIDYFR